MSGVCRGCGLPYDECTEEPECYTCPKCDMDYHMPAGKESCDCCADMMRQYLQGKTRHQTCVAHDPGYFCSCTDEEIEKAILRVRVADGRV